MRVFLGVVAVIICVIFAYKLSLRYTERKKFFSSFSFFNKKLKDEVSYSKKSILNIISEKNEEEDDFYYCINCFFIKKTQFKLNTKKYSEDEINYLTEYLNQIGNTDSLTQIKFLQNAELFLTDKLSKSIDDEKKYKSLYIKLGFLLGLLVLVIII